MKISKAVIAGGLSLTLLSIAGAQSRGYGGYGEVFYAEVEVLRYRPAYEFANIGRNNRCYSDRRSHRRHRKNGTGGMVIGAIIGGVAGSQVGSGNGRKVAIVGGAAAGALIGRHVATRGDNDRDVSYSCRERNGRYQEQRLAGYDVAYSFHGRRHELRTHYEPGRYLRLRIEVVAEE